VGTSQASLLLVVASMKAVNQMIKKADNFTYKKAIQMAKSTD
jgi:hypothetical protein